MLDSIPGTLMLVDCLEQCQSNDSCSSVNYETGLCILFSSNADKLPGKLHKQRGIPRKHQPNVENQVAQEFFNYTWMRSANKLLRTSLDSSSRINDHLSNSRREKSEILTIWREVTDGDFHAEIPDDQQLSIATFMDRARRVLSCTASEWEEVVPYKMCWWFTEKH